MNKFKRIFCVFLGSVTAFGAGAMVACDSGSTPSSDELIVAAADTFDDIYVSTTGYTITAEFEYNQTGGEEDISANSTITAAVINDGGLKADVIINSSTIDTNSSYTYYEMLLRGDYIYTKEIESDSATTADGAALYDGMRVADEINSSLDSYVENMLSGLSENCGSLFTTVLGNCASKASSTSDGYALTFNVAEELNNLCTSLNALAVYMQSATTLTVGDVINSDVFIAMCDKYFDGVTGADIYSLIEYIGEMVAALSGDGEFSFSIEAVPEGTAEQSVHDYLVEVCRKNNLTDYQITDFKQTVIAVQTVITALQTALGSSTMTVTLNFDKDKKLNGLNVEVYDIAILGVEIDLSLTTNIAEGGVQLKATPQEYAIGYVFAYGDDGYIQIYLTNTNAAYIYSDGDYSGDSGTCTYDEGGALATITVDGVTYEYADDDFTITYGGAEYSVISVYMY